MSIHPLFAQAAKQNEGYNGEYDDIDTSPEALRDIEADKIIEDTNEIIEA